MQALVEGPRALVARDDPDDEAGGALGLLGDAALALDALSARVKGWTAGAPWREKATREAGAWRHFTVCELPNSGIEKGQHARDFGFTIVRSAIYAAFSALLWQRLCTSSDAALAGIAGKAVALSYYSYRLPTSLSDEARKVIGEWPAYRVSTTHVMTMQHRMYDCYWQMRMPELELGSDVSVALISYLVSQARGRR